MKTLVVVIGTILVTGCVPHTAISDGRVVPRSSFGYTDKRWYAFNHWDAMLPLMLTCPTSALTPQGDSIFGVDLTGG